MQRMRANKTIKSISEVYKAVSGVKEIKGYYDQNLNIHDTSVQHSKRESISVEKEMTNDLLNLRPFSQHCWKSSSKFS